jgi:glycosyltransferase involved in cell wall biosynthesis
MEQTLARISHQIIAVSEQVKSELVFHGVSSREKITVIPLGFDLTPFLSCEAQKGEFKRELGLGNGARLVGIVGRIFPIKNHRLFLETAALVSANDPSARFVIVGDGLLRNELERHTLQLGIRDRVFFTGWRRDLPRIYADLDVLVVSSDNEGTPVSAIEAMASGCPVVSTQVGGLPDMITDGESGYLVPPRDPKAMAIFILRLLNDAQTAYKMSRNARAIAQERFNIKRLVTDIEKLYQALLKQKNILA